MLVDTFSNRLQKALSLRNMKPSELAEKAKIDKSLISNYLSGNYKARQDRLLIIAKTLDVNPVWLMGYDVSINEDSSVKNSDVEIVKNIISNSDDFTESGKESLLNMIDYFHDMANKNK